MLVHPCLMLLMEGSLLIFILWKKIHFFLIWILAILIIWGFFVVSCSRNTEVLSCKIEKYALPSSEIGKFLTSSDIVYKESETFWVRFSMDVKNESLESISYLRIGPIVPSNILSLVLVGIAPDIGISLESKLRRYNEMLLQSLLILKKDERLNGYPFEKMRFIATWKKSEKEKECFQICEVSM